jgi:SAM-dependent methyltransferase
VRAGGRCAAPATTTSGRMCGRADGRDRDDATVPPTRSPLDVLDEVLPEGTPLVVDVGCGVGSVVRHLARRGARAVGVEIAPEPLARARAHEPVGGERYEQGGAEALPLADGAADVVLFMNSLHHVPGDALDTALAEAARVLRPGGLADVQEPLAEGPYFELLRPVDDETAVRAAAYAAIGRAARHGLAHEREVRFDTDVVHAGFDGFRDRVVLADPGRAAAFAGMEDELRERFERAAERVPDGYRFVQPMRVDLLRRTG